MKYDIQEIARIVRGQLSARSAETAVEHLLTDSRNLSYARTSLFFALKTRTGDGHKYIPGLYENGVRNFVVFEMDEAWKDYEANFVLVEDPLTALQTLAASHRRKFKAPVIGITGSNGKTIVKEWLYQLLEERFIITRSPKSYNSQIGVPLSVWQMDERTELGLFEAGISRKGEMSRLEHIIRPRIGLFTNLGTAHQEGFNSMQEKLEEKAQLFQGCKVVVFRRKYDLQPILQRINPKAQRFTWELNDPQADLNITALLPENGGTRIRYRFEGKDKENWIPFQDEAAVEDALHCLAVTQLLDIDEDMARLEPIAMRLEVKQGKNNCLLINDAYNSDIHSLEIALDFLNQQARNRSRSKTLVLSDIAQTGMPDAQLYTHIASLLEEKKVDRLIGIGPHIRKFWTQFPFQSRFYETTELFLQSDTQFENEIILIKGARPFAFERIVDRWELKRHRTVMEINLTALTDNYKYLKSFLRPETKTMAMIKANAYGCGAIETAQVLAHHHCDYFGVAVADEGVELRKAGIMTPIIVMDPEPGSFALLTEYRLEPEIYSASLLEAFAAFADRQGERDFPIHIKLDTGMHRLGFDPDQMDELARMLKQLPSVKVESVFSHLATADDPSDDAYTKRQLDCFDRATRQLREATGHAFIRHILNTAGVQRFPKYQYEMVRLGVGLYGVGLTDDSPIRPVATLKSVVLQVKHLPATETVGSNRRGVLHRDSVTAAIPIGYADGLRRAFGRGNGYVLIHGRKAPFVGNICMDICMVDVTDIPEVKEGDTAVLFGSEPTIGQLAAELDTIPYEILTSVSLRVKRVYYQE